jgi:hypothetical protein
MNVKQKLKKKRRKAWKQKIKNACALATKLEFRLVDKSQWIPGSRVGYYCNNLSARMNDFYCLLDDKLEVVMEDNLIEIENYLDRLWKLRVFW